LKKNAFKWDKEAEEASLTLKGAMCSAPVLAMPDFAKPVNLETYASDQGIGQYAREEAHCLSKRGIRDKESRVVNI
jgi:hypothetical protein